MSLASFFVIVAVRVTVASAALAAGRVTAPLLAMTAVSLLVHDMVVPLSPVAWQGHMPGLPKLRCLYLAHKPMTSAALSAATDSVSLRPASFRTVRVNSFVSLSVFFVIVAVTVTVAIGSISSRARNRSGIGDDGGIATGPRYGGTALSVNWQGPYPGLPNLRCLYLRSQ